jgi:hypothetical protein
MVFVVTKWDDGDPAVAFSIQGIFTTEKAADTACRDTRTCYFPMALDAEQPQAVVRTAARYPRHEEEVAAETARVRAMFAQTGGVL